MSKQLTRALRVEPVPGEKFRYYVESETAVVPDGEHWQDYAYLVDLVAKPLWRDGHIVCMNHQCGCRDFECRCVPKVKQNQLARCKHIRMARSWQMDKDVLDHARATNGLVVRKVLKETCVREPLAVELKH